MGSVGEIELLIRQTVIAEHLGRGAHMKRDEGEKRSKNSIGLLRCTAMTLEVFCGYGERRGPKGLRYGYKMVTPTEWRTWLMHMHETAMMQIYQAEAARMTHERC
jgi:hypothetical protein